MEEKPRRRCHRQKNHQKQFGLEYTELSLIERFEEFSEHVINLSWSSSYVAYVHENVVRSRFWLFHKLQSDHVKDAQNGKFSKKSILNELCRQ